MSQLPVWLKPHLSPLFAWGAAVQGGTVCRLPETVVVTLQYIAAELNTESFLVSVKRPLVFGSEQFRTDAKCTDDRVVLGGWELDTKRWFSLSLTRRDVPWLFKDGMGAQWASTSAELLASLCALHAFGWIEESSLRKSLSMVLVGGTDNRANEALSLKRATTKWPLMAVNMQLSSALARARIYLNLSWRPREQNVEADDLTNERFDDFDPSMRVNFELADLDLAILDKLVETRGAFDRAKTLAQASRITKPSHLKKKREKSDW